ncbi:MAG: oxidoreductase [Candidatus Omnitrophica bacterium]|nr:oxidoreductase [Candidatus Omnitrophota bacterium]
MKYDNIFNLQGKVAVVAGGAGLIGKELVRGLAEMGAMVILADIDAEKGNIYVKRLTSLNLKASFKYLDITKEKSVINLINYIGKEYGRIDAWINCVYPKTKDWGVKFEYVSVKSWKKNVDMHLTGFFISCQKIAEYMKKQKRGSIINMASIYGMVGPDFSIYKDTKMTTPAAYSAIKGGIITFTKYLASYYGKYNVRVNCISPGGIYDRQPVKFVQNYNRKVPLKRMADKEDVVGAAIYLASDASRYVTGHNLVVDGGWTIV